ncbi:HNH endonuclease signature motif containing protein [Blastococcus sp. TF02A-26]|uniref:HNH endonuclease signature motif containing protein n=1 Tax=Blastococcus sp. TF02A-26 TaxID=2250577 RepID=UPI000DE909A7|nr:HNH endonuclease signature motif containing protein [Blastococcus sp. TF02A-26]RBY84366.1 HNH endonuclease [Blastococcus sp. TF02A-26]
MSLVAGSVSLVEGVLVDWFVEQPAELPRLPVTLVSREQAAAELQRVVAQRAMLAAYEAELVAAMADESPDTDDPPPGVRGARGSWGAQARPAGVSEFFPAELAVVLNCGRGTASNLIGRALVWRAKLPGTLALLGSGALDEARAKVLAEVVEQAEPGVARRVEAQLLEQATELSVGKLRTRAQALLVAVDPGGVDERRARAQKTADVRIYPSTREGMATVTVDLPADEAAAVHDALTRYAGMLKDDGDQRPVGQLRTRVFVDLVLRPWDTTRPAVTAHLQVSASMGSLAGTSTEAGEVSGLAITAGHVRELVRQLDGCGLRAPGGGSVTVAVTDDDGALLATATPAQLRQVARRGCPDHPADQGCDCAVLGRPAAVDRYRPSAAQQRFVHTRDRTCRFPNCGQRVGWADADHVIPHACGGETDCGNLCCLCRSHHRLKTFAPGWQFEMTSAGVLTVTTPSGVTRTTRPPGLRPPPQPSDADEDRPAGGQGPGPRPRPRPPGTRDLIRRSRVGPHSPPVECGDDPTPF